MTDVGCHRRPASSLTRRFAVSIRRPSSAWLPVPAFVLALALVAAVLLGAAVVHRLSTRADVPPPQVQRALPASVQTAHSLATRPPVPPSAKDRWEGVLRAIDRRRMRAWACGNPVMLRSVYTRTSPALARDQEMLRAYVARGLRVTGVSMTYSSVTVTRQAPDVAELIVVDRLGATVAVGAVGQHRVLPQDEPTRHRVVLRHRQGRWRIAAVSIV